VGTALARKLGFPFHDTDLWIESRSGKTIAQCFAEAGEAAFRALESEVLESLLLRVRSGEKMVLATGGGIVLSPENVAKLRAEGRVVWLVASVKTLEERIRNDPASGAKRPPLLGRSSLGEVASVLKEREPLYRAAAHAQVTAEGFSPDEVAARILQDVVAKPKDSALP
jgi:shikimate kinase